MVLQIFQNAMILIALLSIGQQLFVNKTLSSSSSYIIRLQAGILYGLLGIMLMINTVYVNNTILLDFRNVAIIVAAVSGGWFSAIISGILIGAFRLFFLGLNIPSIVGVISALLIGICSGLLVLFIRDEIKKWLSLLIINLIVPSVGFFILLRNPETLLNVLFVYWTGTIIVGIFVFYYFNYLRSVNEMFRKIKESSSKDYLTGVNNVRQFELELNQIMDNSSKYSPISILFIDIDYFKMVNDRYGHINGDKVLVQFTDLLLRTFRQTDVISRNGGEEFTVILLNTPTKTAFEVAERFRKKVEKHQFVLKNSTSVNLSVSIGLATYPEIVSDISRLIEKSDEALYTAKESGRNKISVAQS